MQPAQRVFKNHDNRPRDDLDAVYIISNGVGYTWRRVTPEGRLVEPMPGGYMDPERLLVALFVNNAMPYTLTSLVPGDTFPYDHELIND